MFTLNLPWQLGVSFFLNQLVDGDPAVSLLSWRWVAGLHAKGKRYVARAENIWRFGFNIGNRSLGLNESPQALQENLQPEWQANVDLPTAQQFLKTAMDYYPSGLLVLPTDCSPEIGKIASGGVVSTSNGSDTNPNRYFS